MSLEDCFIDYNYKYHLKISDNFQNENKISKYSYTYNYHSNDNYKRKIKKSIIENLKIKHYIKFGENCPICYDDIISRYDAFLTDCGHSFHLSCIINYDYKNIYNKLGIFCPICRSDIGNYYDLKDRFTNSSNNLDKLEDFNFNIKFKVPKVCFNYHDLIYLNHFQTHNFKNCFYCKY